MNYTSGSNPPPKFAEGDIWYDTTANNMMIALAADFWKPLETTIPITVNGKSKDISISNLSRLATEEAQLKQLVDEQQSVREAYERLQVLVKMYGPKNDESA